MSDDETVNYQSGKVTAISQIGQSIERFAEASVEDAKLMHSNSKAIQSVVDALISYKTRVNQDQQASRIPLKESTYMLKAIDECIKIVKQMQHATEINAIKLDGAVHALSETVKSIKRTYDEEQEKKTQFELYSKEKEKDVKRRPNGYPPEKSQPIKKKTVRQKTDNNK